MNSIVKPVYPENAYCVIFGAQEYPDLPTDAEETLDYVLDTLTPREADMFRFSYKDEWTYLDIGEKHGVTPERVRQVLVKALRKLRHPSRSKILLVGRETYLTTIVAANEERKQKYYERIAVLNELIKQQDAEIAGCQEQTAEMEKQADPAYDILGTSIDELDLTVRAWNCLTRAGIRTIKEIPDLEGLLRIRNLGRRSAQEVQDKLASLRCGGLQP